MDHETRRVTERSLREHDREMYGQLHQHPGASERETSSPGRMSSAVQEHEEVICWSPPERQDTTCRESRRKDSTHD